MAGTVTNVSFRSTFAFNFAGNPTINIEGFGAGGGSLGTVPFSVFNTFPTYDVSAFFNNADLSGFRLAGNGENAGLNVATVTFTPSAVPEPSTLALILISGAAFVAARRRSSRIV